MGERFPSNPMPGLRLSGGARPGRMSMLNHGGEVSHGSSFAQGIQVFKVVISITILISEEPFSCFGVFAALLAL